MGRDGVLPKRIFGYLNPRLQTPVFNVLFSGAVGFIALLLTVSTSTSFINFGAFTAFTFVNLSVIAVNRRNRHHGNGALRFANDYLAPAIGAATSVWLLLNLDLPAKLLGGIWLAIGIAYLAYLTRFFRIPPPEQTVAE
jgi:putrescine importer